MYLRKITLLTLSLALLRLYSCTNKPTVISGSFDQDVDFVLLSNAEVDICHEAFLDTIFLDNKINLELKLDLKEDRFFILRIPDGSKSGFNQELILPIQAGGRYRITLQEDHQYIVSGTNQEGIHNYQTILNYRPESFQWNIFKSDSLSREEVIEKRKQEELDLFKNLLEEKKITSSFYTLIENDRNCLYAFVSAWKYSSDVLTILRNRHDNYDEAKMAEIVDTLTGIYEKHKPDDNNLMKSPQWKHYALFMYIRVYKQYLFKEVNTNNVEALLSREHIPFWFKQIKESFRGKALEAALALLLYEEGGLKGCGELSIPYYNYFLEQFPQSPYLKYFKNQMEETVAFYKDKDFDPSVHFVEPRDSINTFQELLALFRGKRLYVDVWATWCGPCRMQFEFNDLLRPILQRNNIKSLYILTNSDDKQTNTWEGLIKTYNLRGYHFRANKAFLEDLKRIYSTDNDALNPEGKRYFLIPWYMLVDEEGNIVDKHFKKPSELVKDTLAIF